MPTKAQLVEQLMQMHSDAAHLQREHDACVAALNADIVQLKDRVGLLRGAIRPYFLPAGSDMNKQDGTAHCPMCNAVAPAAFRFFPLAGRHMVITSRPIKHHDGCIFAEEVHDG